MKLPIEDALPELLQALRSQGRAVLQAPPGAGKTTRVPLAILEAGLCAGKIIMLEPRRLAARTSATRMAAMLGEPLGDTVGYRIRGEAKTSSATRIEVVTEGILTRRLQSDPELSDISLVIFDEFHERSLNADLGLALCLEVREALRDDLSLLVMSATLDAEPVSKLMSDAPLVTSQGRSYPVEIVHADAPRRPKERLEQVVAGAVQRALSEQKGNLLVFLPGEGEIRRTQAALGDLPDGVHLRPLYGALPFKAQQEAIAPPKDGRKIVLATSIAETSLTIEGITCVIDAGLARRARFDPGAGMSRLVTEKVSRAEADQRAGRAGRLSPGRCYRLWTKGEEGALSAFPPAEIEVADLTGLALELAQWGSTDIPLLTPPPSGALTEAQTLLQSLDALDRTNRLTTHGKAMAKLPLHPRLAHMLLRAGKQAAPLAALLEARVRIRASGSDIAGLLDMLRERTPPSPELRAPLRELQREAKRLERLTPLSDTPMSDAQCAALAYPDRIGLRRPGDTPRWLLSGGKGVRAPDDDTLAAARLIVALDTDGNPREALLRRALLVSEREVRDLYEGQIAWQDVVQWDPRERRVRARKQERFGVLVLKDQILRDASADAIARAALDGVRDLGLPWSAGARRLQARIALFAGHDSVPDCSDVTLMNELETWLLPYLGNRRTAEDIKALDLVAPLQNRLGWEGQSLLDKGAPAYFITPMNRKVPIDYGGEHPEIQVRLQEMFGVTSHPTVGPARVPLRVTLLSPAQRPLQTTMDLPGFWSGSYADVRKDMRARYPRHPWPEDPTQADPTLRAKPRGT